MQQKKPIILYSAVLAALLLLAGFLLGKDFVPFFRWYMAILILGMGFYPLASLLFKGFRDQGWMFSKILGLTVGGYAVWVLVCGGLLKFTNRRTLVVTVICFGVCWALFMTKEKKRIPSVSLILLEEVIFLAVFLLWTYFITFRPDVTGTEKPMDYGFMAAMMRSTTLPAKDIWYGLADINYYYGGQYYAVYLTRLTYLKPEVSYNLMRAMIAAFAYILPFSIVFQMVYSRLESHRFRRYLAGIGGLAAGAAVSLAGNMHYVLYKLFGKVFKLSGYETYWFTDSTRYIGHNPATDDACIHEFPSYSYVLGDLHAHMINIIFVLTCVGLLYAWIREVRYKELDRIKKKKLRDERQRRRPEKYRKESVAVRVFRFLLHEIWEPRLLMAAFFIGIFKWTNYWDAAIYFTVALFCIVFAAFYRYQEDVLRGLGSVIVHVAVVMILATIAALPFSVTFTPMVSSVAFSKYHTAPYQLAVLWGLPFAVFVFFVCLMLYKYHVVYENETAEDKPNRFLGFFRMIPQSDRFALILGICAFGLVMVPEIVYVKDIYENGFARSNTMFKLTYQAYILFALMMAYALTVILAEARAKATRIFCIVLCALFAMTLGYFGYSVRAWFGKKLTKENQIGLNCLEFLEQKYPEDAAAIRWMDENIKGQPLILEANGNSYSDNCRVSAYTGLPTVLGWYVHEWLWRGNPTDLNQKDADIAAIYTTEYAENAKVLVDEYHIQYIFVGSCERATYPELNHDTLHSLGQVIYQDGDTYIIEVND